MAKTLVNVADQFIFVAKYEDRNFLSKLIAFGVKFAENVFS
jgi:hypothetical protein